MSPLPYPQHPSPATLLHVLPAAEWALAGDPYAPPGLERDGFVHLCTADQLAFVLARHFAGRAGLVALRLDPARLGSPVRWERSEPGMAPFPHLYGPIPQAAVVGVDALPGSAG